MARLGYDRYLAQGGDWGSAVTTAIGATDTDHCVAVHVTLAMGARPKFDGDLTPEEQRAVAGPTYYQEWDSGYSKQQGTRPQTVGYGLVDSPAARRPGSSRNSGLGPTATATPRRCSPATSCSTT